ncbi:MAG: 4Fe-4S dicluster domain-containing protein [Pseudomonadota bacterium]
MFFKISFYLALIIFSFGLLFKISTWFRYSFGDDARETGPYKRASAAVKGITGTVFSKRILILLKVFVLDVLLQMRTFRQDFLRWLMHMCLFWGFMSLLVMHAFDKLIISQLFKDYSPTLNPFLFLRNLFFVPVIVGLAIAVYRRFILKVPRLLTTAMDQYVIIILAVIMLSGVFLEGTKILSYTRYQGMVADYSDTDDTEDLNALESYWVKEFGVVSPNLKGAIDKKVLAQGKELHVTSCAACHSRPHWAIVSYGASRAMKPFALLLDKMDVSAFLWYVHFLACFVGLAYLPFSKMFHILASPLSLLSNAVMDNERSHPLNIATRQVMELDACTHCGTCSSQCFVGICFEEISNVNILPSEKLASLKALAAGKRLSDHAVGKILEGLYLCTNCTRCTVVCPVGINLQDLWFNVRETLLQKGYVERLTLSPLSIYRGLKFNGRGTSEDYQRPIIEAQKAIAEAFNVIGDNGQAIQLSDIDDRYKKLLELSRQGNTFSYCFNCKTCTISCPVVRNFEDPPKSLGLVPHQIMHASALGVMDLIFRSSMLWRCLGCYQCQENCPQGVQVTDIIYELKNMAIKHSKGAIKASKMG